MPQTVIRPPGLDDLLKEIRACRLCVENPRGKPLPHAPRPVIHARATARLAICGQAPGTRVHASGRSFSDPSGDRLRAWMGVSSEVFYDEARIAIVPMGFCFPGLDAKGGDLPPRRECADRWRHRVMAALPRVELVLLVGTYAQRWHLPDARSRPMSALVADWREVARPATDGRRYFPLPHPSWRNNAWIKRNPWFEAELLADLRAEVARAVAGRTQKPRP